MVKSKPVEAYQDPEQNNVTAEYQKAMEKFKLSTGNEINKMLFEFNMVMMEKNGEESKKLYSLMDEIGAVIKNKDLSATARIEQISTLLI